MIRVDALSITNRKTRQKDFVIDYLFIHCLYFQMEHQWTLEFTGYSLSDQHILKFTKDSIPFKTCGLNFRTICVNLCNSDKIGLLGEKIFWSDKEQPV